LHISNPGKQVFVVSQAYSPLLSNSYLKMLLRIICDNYKNKSAMRYT
jgi:hypothetical protein